MDKIALDDLKQALFHWEQQEQWNRAIDRLYELWLDDKGDERLCILLISECFWLLSEKASLDDNPAAQSDDYKKIRWDFEDRMLEAARYGLENFQASAYFMLMLGLMWSSVPATLEALPGDGEALLVSAYRLAPDSALCAAVAQPYVDGINADQALKARALQELDALDFKDNLADEQIGGILLFCIN